MQNQQSGFERKDRYPNKVKKWRKVRKILDIKEAYGRHTLGLLVDVMQPEFDNGSLGNKNVSAIIKLNEHYLRLSTKAFCHLLLILKDHTDDLLDAIDSVEAENMQKKYERKSEEDNGLDGGDYVRIGNNRGL